MCLVLAPVARVVASIQDPAKVTEAGVAQVPADLGELSLQELVQLSTDLSELLELRLLAVPDELAAAYADLPGGGPSGCLRLLDPPHRRFAPHADGGAAYSFGAGRYETRDAPAPDLRYDGERLRTGPRKMKVGNSMMFPSNTFSHLLLVGEGPIEELDEDAPEDLKSADRKHWQRLWGPMDSGTDPYSMVSVGLQSEPPELTTFRAVVGRRYLLRCRSPGMYDKLIALGVLERDELGILVAWRQLASWPMPASPLGMPVYPWSMPPAPVARDLLAREEEDLPAWMRALSTEDLLETAREVQEDTAQRLLEIPADVRVLHATFLEAPDTGIFKLLPQGEFDRAVAFSHGASGYSFRDGTHDPEEPDLRLVLDPSHPVGPVEYFQTARVPGWGGALFDLGELPIERFLDPKTASEGLMKGELAALKGYQTQKFRHNSRNQIRLPAVSGHTYLLRSALNGEKQAFIVFQVVDTDRLGHTLLFKVMQRW